MNTKRNKTLHKGNKQKTYFAKQNNKVTVSLTIIQDLCVFLIFFSHLYNRKFRKAPK